MPQVLTVQSPNRDCHKDCPSCTGACEPKQQDATIPAGTRVLMAWHTLAADPVLYPDPASFNPRRSVAGNAEDLANTNLGLDTAARGHAHVHRAVVPAHKASKHCATPKCRYSRTRVPWYSSTSSS